MSLIALLEDKEILVGAIDVATNHVETADEVASVLKSAVKYADAERIYGCSNCGMAPLPRTVAAEKLKALAAGAAMARKEVTR
jgi:5-methyltetrahydropteroyltriglutamate--homocysteine methyltransferase